MIKIDKKITPNKYPLWGTVEAIILHTTLGAYEGAVEWLMTSPEERLRLTGVKSWSSAHFVIGRNGEITQLADLNVGTWHAGVISNPSQKAKAVLPKYLWGRLKNPNRYTIGIEFVSGYDIDKDGIIEGWEKLYTPAQIKACAELIKTVIEPELKKTFSGRNILTHKDITSYKPDLTIQQVMVASELKKIKEPPKIEPVKIIKPKEEKIITLETGEILQIKIEKGKATATIVN